MLPMLAVYGSSYKLALVATLTVTEEDLPLTLNVRGRDTNIKYTVDGQVGYLPKSTNVNADIKSSVIITEAGTYTLNVYGSAARLTLANKCLTSIDYWDTRIRIPWVSFHWSAFTGDPTETSPNLVTVPDYLPSTLINISNMFYACSKFNDPNVLSWDTSNVAAMASTFRDAALFDQPIFVNNLWNTSKVTSFNQIFYGYCRYNQPTTINAPVCTNISNMFAFNKYISSDISITGALVRSADSFMQGAIAYTTATIYLNLPEVTSMNLAFNTLPSFNTPVLEDAGWHTPKLTSMRYFLADATSFDQEFSLLNAAPVNLDHLMSGCTAYSKPFKLNGTKATTVTRMLYGCINFDHSLADVNFELLTSVDSMLLGCAKFNSALPKLTTRVTNYHQFLMACSVFNHPSIIDLPTSNATVMTNTFNGALAMAQDISWWCVPKILSEPQGFAAGNTHLTPAMMPKWGTCPEEPMFIAKIDSTGHATNSNLVITVNGDTTAVTNGTRFTGTVELVNPANQTLVASETFNNDLIKNVEFTITPNAVYNLNIYGKFDKPSSSLTHPNPASVIVAGNSLVEVVKWSGMTKANVGHYGFYRAAATGLIKYNSPNLKKVPASLPQGLLSIKAMFKEATSFTGTGVSLWNTAELVNMEEAFYQCSAFTTSLGNWRFLSAQYLRSFVHNCVNFNGVLGDGEYPVATDMQYFMANCYAYTKDIYINAPRCTAAQYMTSGLKIFNGSISVKIGTGLLSATAINAAYLFASNEAMNTPITLHIGSEGRSYVYVLSGLFKGCKAYNQPVFDNAPTWNIQIRAGVRVQVLELFMGASAFNQPIVCSGLIAATNAMYFLSNAVAFNNIIQIDFTDVTNALSFFAGATNWNGIIPDFGTGVNNFSDFLNGCSNFNNASIEDLGVRSARSMTNFAYNATKLDQDLSMWCVPLIAEQPSNFVTGTAMATKTAQHPMWGSCPIDNSYKLEFTNVTAGDELHLCMSLGAQGKIKIKTSMGITQEVTRSTTSIVERDIYGRSYHKFKFGIAAPKTIVSISGALGTDLTSTTLGVASPKLTRLVQVGDIKGKAPVGFPTLDSVRLTFNPDKAPGTSETLTCPNLVEVPNPFVVPEGNLVGMPTFTGTGVKEILNVSLSEGTLNVTTAGSLTNVEKITFAHFPTTIRTVNSLFANSKIREIEGMDLSNLSLEDGLVGMFSNSPNVTQELIDSVMSGPISPVCTNVSRFLQNTSLKTLTFDFTRFKNATHFASYSTTLTSVTMVGTENLETLERFFNESTSLTTVNAKNFSKATNMFAMFYNAANVNFNASGWCVPLITTKPSSFDYGASKWTLGKPAWGTCPA